MTIWNGLTSDGAVVPIQVDDQGRVIAIGSGPDSPLVVDGNYLRPRDETKGLGTKNINLDAAGSATFAGNAMFGGQPSDGAAAGARVNAYGNVMVCRENGADPTYLGYLKGRVPPTSRINADGTATFGDFDNHAGVRINFADQSGNVACDRTDGTQGVFYGKLNGDTKTSILADGSATFAGTVAAESTSGAKTQINGDGFYQRTTDGSSTAAQILANGSATFAGKIGVTGQGSSNTVFYVWDANNNNQTTIGFNANGSAQFADNVIAKNITAFSVVLKAAVRNSTTFDELKTAIIEALIELVPSPEPR